RFKAGKRGFYGKPAIHSPARPAGLRGKIKEEAFAAGGCRGTFAPKACRSRRARQIATRRAIRQEDPFPDLGEEPKKTPDEAGAEGRKERGPRRRWPRREKARPGRRRASRRRWGRRHGPRRRYRSNPKPMPAELSPLLKAPPIENEPRSPICFE